MDVDNVYFSASDTLETAMLESDGPETICVYKLVETKRIKKVIQVT